MEDTHIINLFLERSEDAIRQVEVKYEKPTTGIIMRPSKNFSLTKSNRLFIHFILIFSSVFKIPQYLDFVKRIHKKVRGKNAFANNHTERNIK